MGLNMYWYLDWLFDDLWGSVARSNTHFTMWGERKSLLLKIFVTAVDMEALGSDLRD